MQLWRLRSPRSAVSKLETQESQWHKFKSKFKGRRPTSQLSQAERKNSFLLNPFLFRSSMDWMSHRPPCHTHTHSEEGNLLYSVS